MIVHTTRNNSLYLVHISTCTAQHTSQLHNSLGSRTGDSWLTKSEIYLEGARTKHKNSKILHNTQHSSLITFEISSIAITNQLCHEKKWHLLQKPCTV